MDDLPSPEEVRRCKRGRLLARLVERYAAELAPALAALLAGAVGEQVRDILAAELPGAMDALGVRRRKPSGGGRR